MLLGFGKEGRSSYNFIRQNFTDKRICIADLNENILIHSSIVDDPNTSIILGHDYQDKLKDFDLIIKSPGIKLNNTDNDTLKMISSQTDLFLMGFRNQTVGVTGTKGKSTTVSLIDHILKYNGRNSFLIGNIGIPALEMASSITKDDIIVYELSAHQLEYVNYSPHISVLLNVFPEHLDYFENFEDYKSAKFNILAYQQPEDRLILSSQIASDIPKNNAQVVELGIGDTVSFEQIKLIGDHNMLNVEFAIMVASELGINREGSIAALESFKPLPHRLEDLGVHGCVRFINDSISTIPQSVIAALNALDRVDVLILGGFDRGLDYSELCNVIEESNIKKLIFLGKAGLRIYKQIPDTVGRSKYMAENMIQVFDIIEKIYEINDVCLLSPAAASYDQFRNFEHRGEMFRKLSASFGEKKS